ncbi:CatA-like O-acetyltransferase [Undibacterium sp. SXout11W]|uniref:CatA-like O-acetyltransferase n=1 Tax=Undibacterium sp. SXout11W TaxID=3413050 RepID=UPI003BF030A4
MKKILDLSTWNRREHYQFFSQLDEPFHGIIADVDCSKAYAFCKQEQQSFFLYYLHKTLIAINHTEAMRYRIENQQVVMYDTIHVNATISRADHTFGFCPIYFKPDFSQFAAEAQLAMQKVKDSSGLCFNDECARDDVIHFSAMPWIKFTGITHARQHDGRDSVPKISVGKCEQKQGKMLMPVGTFVHHGLVDAYHVHQFLQRLEIELQS